MSRRKAFQAGEGTFVIADEFADEVYIGIAAIDTGPAPRKPNRAKSFFAARGSALRSATMPAVSVLVTLAFSLGAMIAGIVLARAWR
jgi:hypothetical protein